MAYKQPSGLQYAQGNLDSAAMNAMDTTAQTLIAAPGAGLMNVVVACFFNIKIGSTPWNTGVANMWLVYGTTANDQTNLASGLLTNQVATMSASTNYVFGGARGAIGADWLGSTDGNIVKVLSSNTINKAISITCVDPISGGNGNMDWKIWYVTIPAV